MAILDDNMRRVLEAFNQHEVQYLLVGGLAVLVYGYGRTTHDLDLWVAPTIENGRRVLAAAEAAGHGVADLRGYDFQKALNFHLGVGSSYVDVLTQVKEVSFAEAKAEAVLVTIEDVEVPCIHFNHLIRIKEATGRPQDVADAAQLRKINAHKNNLP